MEAGDNVSHNHNHHHHPNMQHPAMGTTNLPQQPEREGEAPPRPPGKLENGVNSTDPWGDGSAAALNKGGLVVPPLVETQGAPPPSSVVSQAAETPGGGGGGGVSVKVATTVLHPLCLGEGPVVLPIHLQMAGAAGAPPLGQMGATPYFMTSQGPLSLPLVLDPQLLHHLSSQMASGCGALPLQNNVLCQNASLTFGLPPPPPPPLPPPPPPPLDQKSSGGSSSPDSNLLSLLQNPAFAAILQDLFSSQAAASSACQSPGSGAPPPNADPFTSFFTSPPPPHAPPPPLSHPYASSSPLAPLVPPPTLLVPYPVVIPLPVPLPIPLPIPVPVNVPHQAQEDSKGNVVPPRAPPVCTVSRSTQTCTREATSSSSTHSSHSFSHRFAVAPPQPPPHAAPPPQCSSSPEGEVLDLSVARVVKQPKQEFPPSPPQQQDNVLDLSVSGKQKKYIQLPCVASAATSTSLGAGGGDGREFAACHQQAGPEPPPLSLAVLGDPKLLSGLASLEFSRQHKWLAVDATGGVACSAGGSQGMMTSLGGGGGVAMGPAAEGNLEIVSASSHATAKVIVSVKDAIPAAILCGKIKGLSGVSTKNFSIKRDGAVGIPAVAALQKLYGAPPSSSSSGPPGGVVGVGAPEQQQQQHDPSDLLGRKAPKNRAIKVKKVGSQEIHFLPIKKQRLAAFLPRK